MELTLARCLIVAVLLTKLGAMASADDAKEDAIKQDHRLIEGTWQVVSLEVNGNKSAKEDVKKLTVVNGSDGTWKLYSEGKDVTKGTSTIDPTQKPKAIDLTPADGNSKGMVLLGIYELGDKSRKLCYAPVGKKRPTEFSSTPENGHILVQFERKTEK